MGGTYFVYRESLFDFGQQMNYGVLSIALEGFEMNRTWIKWQVTIFSFRGPYMTSVEKCSRNFPLGRVAEEFAVEVKTHIRRLFK